jgi:hypothetical protein
MSSPRGARVSEIAADLVTRFAAADGPAARLVERDVCEFVDLLLAADLVREVADRVDPAAAAAPGEPAAGHE